MALLKRLRDLITLNRDGSILPPAPDVRPDMPGPGIPSPASADSTTTLPDPATNRGYAGVVGIPPQRPSFGRRLLAGLPEIISAGMAGGAQTPGSAGDFFRAYEAADQARKHDEAVKYARQRQAGLDAATEQLKQAQAVYNQARPGIEANKADTRAVAAANTSRYQTGTLNERIRNNSGNLLVRGQGNQINALGKGFNAPDMLGNLQIIPDASGAQPGDTGGEVQPPDVAPPPALGHPAAQIIPTPEANLSLQQKKKNALMGAQADLAGARQDRVENPIERENADQWVANSINPDPNISGPAKQKLAAYKQLHPLPAAPAVDRDLVKAAMESAAQSLAAGDLSKMRDITSMRGDQRIAVFARAREINPKFNTAEIDRKIKMEDAFTNGKDGQNLQSFGTFLEHGGAASEAVNAIRQTNSRVLNKPLNWVKQNLTGDPNFQAFLVSLEPVRKEFEGFLLGGRALYGDDRKNAEIILNNDSSLAQIQAALKQMGHTAKARFNEANYRYKRTMGKDIAEPFSPEATEGARRIGVDLTLGAGHPAANAGPPQDRIRVREKSTGQTGSMPRANFDPSKYEEVK